MALNRIDMDVALGDRDSGERTQCAALCYRLRKGKPQILMITSRRTKRWILPKGWLMKDRTLAEAAAQEAWEEAGVQGRIGGTCLGLYTYIKEAESTGEVDLPCATLVFPLKVKSLKRKYPEKGQRKRRWMSRKKAASRVWEPELAELIRSFDPAAAAGQG